MTSPSQTLGLMRSTPKPASLDARVYLSRPGVSARDTPPPPNEAETEATQLLASHAFCDASAVSRITGAPGIASV